MKHLLLLFALLFCHSCFSQWFEMTTEDASWYKKFEIKTLICYNVAVKDSTDSTFILTEKWIYSKKNNLLTCNKYDKKGKKTGTYKMNFNNQDILSSNSYNGNNIKIIKANKKPYAQYIINGFRYKNDSLGRLISTTKDSIYKCTYWYNSDSTLDTISQFSKFNDSLTYYYNSKFHYDSNGKITKSVTHQQNDSLTVFKWIYKYKKNTCIRYSFGKDLYFFQDN